MLLVLHKVVYEPSLLNTKLSAHRATRYVGWSPSKRPEDATHCKNSWSSSVLQVSDTKKTVNQLLYLTIFALYQVEEIIELKKNVLQVTYSRKRLYGLDKNPAWSAFPIYAEPNVRERPTA